ncbi:MAG: hypothetical protein WDN00_19220 [Limisphaerales bacterium]
MHNLDSAIRGAIVQHDDAIRPQRLVRYGFQRLRDELFAVKKPG